MASVMKSTVINTSKELMVFSDFPLPDDAPVFMNNKLVLEYLRSYAEHFKLLRYCQFSTEVLRVARAPDHTESREWIVQYHPVGSNASATEMRVGGVMLCTGHHNDPYIPTFPGQDRFEGKIIHSIRYKTPFDYVGQRVLCIGAGNSAGDIAVELAQNAVAEKDDSVASVDTIFLGTGFNISFPYLEEGVIPVSKENGVSLFKYIYNPELEHPETLGVMGFVQPNLIGSTGTTGELQARVFCAALTKEITLPSRPAMINEILQKQEYIKERFAITGDPRRYSLEIEHIPFMDELSTMIGACPSAWDYLPSDPALAWHLMKGPLVPSLYRLKGPHTWPKARDTILTTMDRVWAPTQKHSTKRTNMMTLYVALVVVVLLIAYLWM